MSVWAQWILAVGVGLGVLLVGVAVFVLCLRTAGLVKRLGGTLDEVDRQLSALGGPVAQTLSNIGGITDTADVTLARLVGVVDSLETVASNVSKTSTLAQEALAPPIVNIGATLTGATAGLRRLITGKDDGTGTSTTPDGP